MQSSEDKHKPAEIAWLTDRNRSVKLKRLRRAHWEYGDEVQVEEGKWTDGERHQWPDTHPWVQAF